tara:strand:- start:314 stop:472 length:159 start_codon:yes stop_codon:yes gene_type:complete
MHAGGEMESKTETEEVQLTPKGFFCGLLSVHFAIGDSEANEGGSVIGAEVHE